MNSISICFLFSFYISSSFSSTASQHLFLPLFHSPFHNRPHASSTNYSTFPSSTSHPFHSIRRPKYPQVTPSSTSLTSTTSTHSYTPSTPLPSTDSQKTSASTTNCIHVHPPLLSLHHTHALLFHIPPGPPPPHHPPHRRSSGAS